MIKTSNNNKTSDNMPEYDYCFKVILIGDTAVGKTSLLNRFADDFYTEEFIATIGVDFKIRTLPIEDKQIRVQFWDTAGQERFRSITTCYFRSSNGVIVVYDVCNPTTFYNVAEWMKLVSEHCTENVVKFIIGNKCDSESERKISTQQGQRLAAQYGAGFAETSAQSDVNVRRVFLEMVGILKKQGDEQGIGASVIKRVASHVFVDHDQSSNEKERICCSLM